MEWLYKNWKKFGKNFEEGGKLSWLSSFYDAFDTFLFTPQTTAKRNGTHIHDGSDSKRTMILVVIALVPALLFGMFNVGYQHLLATGQLAAGMTAALWWKAFGFGLLAVLPYIIVSLCSRSGHRVHRSADQARRGSRRIPRNGIHHSAHRADQHAAVAGSYRRGFRGHLRERGVRRYGL